MKKTLFAIAAAAVALCGCDTASTEESIITPDQNQDLSVSFTPSITAVTRVVSDLFESNDEIYVNAVDANGVSAASLVPYTYNNMAFSSDTPITYESTSQKLMFYAVYPATKSLSNTFAFSAMADQNSGDNYEMSDLLLSKSSYTTDNSVDLAFNHMMTSIVVNIITPGMDGGVLTIYGATDAIVDVDNYSCVANDTTAVAITPAYTSDGYKVILAPQTIAADVVMATYEIDGTTYQWMLDSNKTYASGCRYYLNWDLEENLVSFGGYINGWDDVMGDADGDTDTDGGVADDATDDDFASYIPEIPVNVVEFSAEKNEMLIEVDSAFTSVIVSDVDWIYSELSNCVLTISVAENMSYESRSGEVIIEGDGFGGIITVLQAGVDPTTTK